MTRPPTRLGLEPLDVPGTPPIVLPDFEPLADAPWVRDGLKPTVGAMYPGGKPQQPTTIILQMQAALMIARPGQNTIFVFDGRFVASADIFGPDDDGYGDLITGIKKN